MARIDTLIAETLETWRPPKRMSLSEWADEFAYLSSESSAQDGKWRTYSYQRGLQDAMTDPEVETVVCKKSARVGYTKCLNNLIGYHIHQDPTSIMLVQPTLDDAEGYSKEEIAPMLRDTPVLRGLVHEAKAKDSNNTLRSKSFRGGVLGLVGANSPGGFRRVSRRVVLFDEISGYPPSAGAEGDQIKLGTKRSEMYWNRKIVMGSTPTVVGACRVSTEFEKTDQRRYFVPCPHCGEFQYLKWGGPAAPFGLTWPKGEPRKAVYVCEHNGCVIQHIEKYDMLEKGEWRPTATAERPGLVGFHIWAAYSYSPNSTWVDLAVEYEDSKGHPEKLKTFTNTALGEAFAASGDKADAEGLAARSELYAAEVLPEGVVLLTAGTDNQGNRLESEIVGWGAGEETWSIDYIVTRGDPDNVETWLLHDINVLNRIYTRADGVQLRVARCCVDTGGSRTQAVYEAIRARIAGGVLIATKGMPGEGRPIISAPSTSNLAKIPLCMVGTFAAKDLILGRLQLEEEGPGYCHFPQRYSMPEFIAVTGVHYFKGLTSEEVRTKVDKKGFMVREWHQTYARNEPLDCRVLATAAFASLNIRIDELLAHLAQPDDAGRQVRGTIVPNA